MRAISLWQPWATLWVCGLKINETRSWPIRTRPELVVHASKKWDRATEALCLTEPFASALRKLIPDGRHEEDLRVWLPFILPRGKIVGLVKIDGCYRIGDEDPAGATFSTVEHAFGNWTAGRYRWEATNPRAFRNPYPITGRQGFFDVGDNLVRGLEIASPAALSAPPKIIPLKGLHDRNR